MKRGNKIILSLSATLILANSVYAKEPTSLDAITVTAQKSAENVQEVPISITVFDEFSIADMKIKSVNDIAQYTPNLMLLDNGGAGSFTPTIRGLMTEQGSPSASVGIFIDGIPMIGTSGFDSVLTDVERIEVLKGPQGTLYGRGTEGGVINIITKKPNNETKGQISLELGSDNKKEISFGLSAPIIKDKLFIGVSGKHYEKDGLIKNTYLGGHSDDREHNFGKINLRYTPTDTLDIFLISSILKHKDGGYNFNPLNQARENASNEQSVEPETILHALKVEYDFDKYKFESITTYQDIKYIQKRDYDYTPEAGMHTIYGDDNSNKNISQEFRLSGEDDKLKWLVGLNADKKDKTTSYEFIYNGNSSYTNNTLDGNSYGAFVHTNYALSNDLSVIGGLRYDKNDANFKDKNLDLDSSESEISPKFGFEYNLNKDSMLYTTVSKGYRPGGFYTYAAEGYSKTFKKETLWSYEVGSKNSFLDNTLVLNAAIYYMDIDDMQVITTVGTGRGSTYKSNAAEATSKGIEFDLNYQASDTLKLFASFGYNDIKFDTYKDNKGDYSGNRSSLAPKYNYNIGAQYRSASGYYARADINGYGDMYLDNKNNKYKKDAYNLVNTRIGYETEDYDIYLYADNLFDKVYDSTGSYQTIYSAPREIGVQLAYRF